MSANSEPFDRIIQCCSCPQVFMFTVRDQQFYQSQGFHDPVRCRDCRLRRKNKAEAPNKRKSRHVPRKATDPFANVKVQHRRPLSVRIPVTED